jgi:hypothetical protein
MFRSVRSAVLALAILVAPSLAVAGPKALFDNTHAETAGNADWVIDTDQPLPVPDQSTVSPATDRTYWLGAISSWGIDLVKRGYTVATLTTANGITYGNAANPYDLSKYDVFIVDEPNTRFTAAESTAIFNYVRDGGGMIAISDHDISDRNNDKFDSPRIWDLLDRNHFFGVHFDTTGEATNNIVQNSGNVETALSDSIIHGPNGLADSVSFHNGTVMTLYPAVNPSVTGDIWINGQAHATTNAMVAHAVYGNGRIVWVGDSSPADDGSAAPGNSSIFDGWGEASGRDSLLFQNATMWATRRTTTDGQPPTVTVTSPNGGETWKAGSTQSITWSAGDNVGVATIDIAWSSDGGATYPNAIATGIANGGSYAWTVPNAPTTTARVRVTAHDAAGNAGSDAGNGNMTIDTWVISATAGANGSISPSGSVPVVQGAAQGFTIAPDAGFAIASLLVDGGAVAPAASYTFTNVTANHTIAAAFADAAGPTVTVTSPNGGELWRESESHHVTWTATDNLGVDSVDVDVSLDGAEGPWIAVAHGLANTGDYEWIVPAALTDSALVRVTARDAAANAASDTSDAMFRIYPPLGAVSEGEAPRFALAHPSPNPSQGTLTLRFSLADGAETRIEILDVAGRRLRTLALGPIAAGDHAVTWNGRDESGARVRAGTYFVRLVSGASERRARLVRW